MAEHEPVEVDVAQWHEYTIIAQGNHLIHKIDGQVTIDLVDHDEAKRSLEGIVAFQIHRGPAMKVQIKDVMLKELPEGGVVAFDQAALPAGSAKVEKKSKPKKNGAEEQVVLNRVPIIGDFVVRIGYELPARSSHRI